MNLATTYLGLKLKTPLVPSASPLSLDNIKRMEDAGAAAIVLHSLFEEQMQSEQYEFQHSLPPGADVAMLCSVLLRRGISHLAVDEKELRDWMERHEFLSIERFQGTMSQRKCPDSTAFERAHYVKAVGVPYSRR